MRPPEPTLRDRHFAEQWHAHVIALAEMLIVKGQLSGEVWSRALGAEVDRRLRGGAQDSDATYYSACLSVLEAVLENENLVTASDVDESETRWREAYENTPHGQPVTL